MIWSRRTIEALAGGLHLAPLARGSAVAGLGSREWLSVVSLANQEMLSPALYAALGEAGEIRRMPAEVREYLAFLHACNRERNRLLERQALEAVAALNGCGVRPLLLKGALFLLDGPLSDPAARMMADIDIVVPPAQRGTSETVLERLGYRVAEAYPEGHHAVAEFARDGDPGAIDLHVELVDQPYLLPASEVWRRARPSERAGAGFFVPSATDRVLHTLLHAQIHHLGGYYRGHVALRQIHDLAVLARSGGCRVDWPMIADRMRAHRLRTALESYLLLARKLYGLPWPEIGAPAAASRMHAAWCLAQVRAPAFAGMAVPPGNLWAAFAWHRMRAKYGADGASAFVCRCRHARSFVARHSAREAVVRLFGRNRAACRN